MDLCRCLQRDESVIDKLASTCLLRLTRNLVAILESCLDALENHTELPFSSVMPWIVLYRYLQVSAGACGLAISNSSLFGLKSFRT